MPELRKDPVIGRWVIIATERSKRPDDFGTLEEQPQSANTCPFCTGNEDKTPPEILAYREPSTSPDEPGWRLRVVSNKFPALRIEGQLDRRAEGMFDKMQGVGAHEVIIESPDHEKRLEDLEQKAIEDILWAYRDRVLDLKKDPRFQYILIFKNQGRAAGASLSHSHSQLIATPIVPKRVMEELEGASEYYEYKERCVFCDIVTQELKDRVRVIGENKDFVAIAPFASRFPFETWIIPKTHEAHFEKSTKPEFSRLAGLLKDTIGRIKEVLHEPPYNYVIHTAPIANDYTKEYHWHIEIMPKLTRVAGFEWGTGFYINPTPPEEAVSYLLSNAESPGQGQ
ncbi:galactose-1-phosphate uridylyltransferase [Candidatus Zixiibacteriota bacterium]